MGSEMCIRDSSYKESSRTIEPYTLGSNLNTGKTLLRAFQVDGESSSGETEGWKLMDVNKLDSIEIDGGTFQVREGYKRNDVAMTGGIIEEI